VIFHPAFRIRNRVEMHWICPWIRIRIQNADPDTAVCQLVPKATADQILKNYETNILSTCIVTYTIRVRASDKGTAQLNNL
jgi:hypothetical protein